MCSVAHLSLPQPERSSMAMGLTSQTGCPRHGGWPDLWTGGGGLHSVWNSSNMQPWGAHLLAGARRVLPLITAFSIINLNFFLKDKTKLILLLQEISGDKESVSCVVAACLWQLSKQLKTQICSLFWWRGLESTGLRRHNYQVMDLWDGEGHCAGKKMAYTCFQEEEQKRE